MSPPLSIRAPPGRPAEAPLSPTVMKAASLSDLASLQLRPYLLSARDKDGRTLLMWAAFVGKVDVVAHALQGPGAKAVDDVDKQGCTVRGDRGPRACVSRAHVCVEAFGCIHGGRRSSPRPPCPFVRRD